MKFCENCGKQLADDAAFCEGCGAKQEMLVISNENVQITQQKLLPKGNDLSEEPPRLKEIKLSDTCKTGKREIKGWIMVLLLTIFSPGVLFLFTWWLPDIPCVLICIGIPFLMLIKMWRRRTWRIWSKLLWTIIYVMMIV